MDTELGEWVAAVGEWWAGAEGCEEGESMPSMDEMDMPAPCRGVEPKPGSSRPLEKGGGGGGGARE